MKALIIEFFGIGFSIYIRSFWEYKEFYFPGISVTFGNLISMHKVDFEIKILCFGIGFYIFKKNKLWN